MKLISLLQIMSFQTLFVMVILYSVTQEFSYTKFNAAVGDEISPVYENGYQDKAVLVNLVPDPFNDKK